MSKTSATALRVSHPRPERPWTVFTGRIGLAIGMALLPLVASSGWADTAKGTFVDVGLESLLVDFQLRHTFIMKKINGKFLIIHEHASVPDASIGIETPAPKS